MNSTWPIVFGILAVVAAAFWYDATVASHGGSGNALETPVRTAP